jgi:peptidoglycan/xylan/chitin deacetylase (PgdA/CDA1 family)
LSNKLKINIKTILAYFFYYTGLIFILEQIFLKHRCIVLIYHRITSPAKELVPLQDGMYVEPEIFEEHLRYLKKHFKIISLEELISIMKSRKSFKKFCHITFDDGWQDNYSNAYPLLKKYEVPATIFLATDFIGTEEWFWPEKIMYLLIKTQKVDIEGDFDEATTNVLKIFHQPSVSHEDRINKSINFMKQKTLKKIALVISDLHKITGVKTFPRKRLLLNWNEVQEMMENRISFGSHTKKHAILTSLENIDEIRKELSDSKKIIEEKISKPIKSFCYPNGNYTPAIIQLVKDSGYESAFGTESGKLSDGDNLYNMKRISIHNDVSFNRPMFACRLLLSFF